MARRQNKHGDPKMLAADHRKVEHLFGEHETAAAFPVQVALQA